MPELASFDYLGIVAIIAGLFLQKPSFHSILKTRFHFFLQKSCPGWTVVVLLVLMQAAEAQTPASTNAPAAAAPPTAIALPNVVAEADSTLAKLQDMTTGLNTDPTLADLDDALPRITRQIDDHQREDAKLPTTGASLATLRAARGDWSVLSDNLGVSQRALVTRLTVLGKQIDQLSAWTQLWQQTLVLAKASAAPADIVQRINGVLTALGQTTKAAQSARGNTLSAQGRVAEQANRIHDALTDIQNEEKNAVGLLFTRDSAPLWSTEVRAQTAPAAADANSLAAQIQALRAYVADMRPTMLIHLFGFILLASALFWIRREVNARVPEEPALQHAAAIFDVPLATAALLALFIGAWLYPAPPVLFIAGLEAAALIPAAIILRRLVAPTLFPILYAMVLAFLFDLVRHVVDEPGLVSRSLFIFELLAVAIFLAWLNRSRRGVAVPPGRKMAVLVVRIYAHVALVVFIIAGLANTLGYVNLSLLLGNGALSSGYLAVILYAAVQIVDALTLSALQIRPLSGLGPVQRHHALIIQKSALVVRWAAALFWFWESLDFFSPLRAIFWEMGTALLVTKIGWDGHFLTIGDIVAFGLTVWASFFVSKLIRFALDEEVFPHLHLPAGVPYTASTLIHYLILILGFFGALEFLNIHLSDYAILGGAFGVGLGFGLQNIMNNFVSGIILLFERPIKVGDIIQIDTAVGTVESIGIRASIIRMANGSEIIVPNGNLISNPVTNWTFSNRRRMVDVPVTVAAKTEPKQVITLLVKIASAHPLVMKDPPPEALVTSFTATALALELRAWTSKPDEWGQLRSDLSVAINAELAKENIAIV